MGLGVRAKAGRKPRVEVRSNADFGWYDGNVSLVGDDDDEKDKSEELQARVHFTGFKETDDEFWGSDILHSELEIRKRVRLRSHQLQDKECGKVFVGMVVCAHFKSSDGRERTYYDAVVTRVSKAVHRKKTQKTRGEICRCRFTLQWQEGPVKGTSAALKCGDISLITAQDVGNHSVVRALLDFAKDYSVVTPVVSQLAKPEESNPGSQVSPHNALNLEGEVSPEEQLEIMEVQEREGSQVEISKFKGVQEGLEREKPEKEVNQQQESREEKVKTIEVQEQEDFVEEKLEVNKVREEGNFTGEDFEMRDVQVQRACTAKSEIEEVQEQEMLEVNSEEEDTGEREGLRDEEPEQENQEKLNWEGHISELDWDEQLELERMMDESESHYRVYDDEFLDLPPDIANHLKNFQLVQDCLVKGSLELEKVLRSKSLELEKILLSTKSGRP